MLIIDKLNNSLQKLALSIIVFLFACQESVPNSLEVTEFERCGTRDRIYTTLTLPIGKSQFIGETNIEVGFSHIYIDSRCPSDVLCKWEGMARIAVWLKAPDQDTLFLEPVIYGSVNRSSPIRHKTVLSDRFGIALQQFDPYPVLDTTGLDLSDTIAYLAIEEYSPPLDQSVITLVDGEVYGRFEHNDIDPFGIDSIDVRNDSLLVYVNYSGGCNEHDFYTFGSLAWMESQPPVMPVTIIHDGHLDACDAIIRKTLAIDLGPVTELSGYGNEVVIEIGPQKHRVHYSW